jgi:hypothetical protein
VEDGNLLAAAGSAWPRWPPRTPPLADMAAAILDVVNTTHGKRPFRVHIDPADDGAAVVNAVADRIRTEFLTHIGLDDLLHPPEIVAA